MHDHGITCNRPRQEPAARRRPRHRPHRRRAALQTRGGNRYLLALDVAPDTDTNDDYPLQADDVAHAADQLLASDPTDSDRATAELLNYVAATWEKQDLPLRQHAQAVARSLTQ
ncbi:hypothetical protein ACFWGL_36365 [Streptomyces sp. NPDC060286]|uniref:hypothetical protein n=1 Tax=unclassified Streptomyces TaxID=2593676 RepID=UPI0035D8EF1F